MQGWERDGVPWRLTMSLTPPLLSMLGDELLRARYRATSTSRGELVDKELLRTKYPTATSTTWPALPRRDRSRHRDVGSIRRQT